MNETIRSLHRCLSSLRPMNSVPKTTSVRGKYSAFISAAFRRGCLRLFGGRRRTLRSYRGEPDYLRPRRCHARDVRDDKSRFTDSRSDPRDRSLIHSRLRGEHGWRALVLGQRSISTVGTRRHARIAASHRCQRTIKLQRDSRLRFSSRVVFTLTWRIERGSIFALDLGPYSQHFEHDQTLGCELHHLHLCVHGDRSHAVAEV